MNAQSMRSNCCKMSIIHRYDNNSSKKEGGARSQPLETYNTQSSKGLDEIYTKWQICRNVRVAGQQLQSKLEMDEDS